MAEASNSHVGERRNSVLERKKRTIYREIADQLGLPKGNLTRPFILKKVEPVLVAIFARYEKHFITFSGVDLDPVDPVTPANKGTAGLMLKHFKSNLIECGFLAAEPNLFQAELLDFIKKFIASHDNN